MFIFNQEWPQSLLATLFQQKGSFFSAFKNNVISNFIAMKAMCTISIKHISETKHQSLLSTSSKVRWYTHFPFFLELGIHILMTALHETVLKPIFLRILEVTVLHSCHCYVVFCLISYCALQRKRRKIGASTSTCTLFKQTFQFQSRYFSRKEL